jgi:KUP system potassium uptake protein
MDSHKPVRSLVRISAGGLLVTLGIVFGDIGTSPLYVMQAILSGGGFRPEYVIGAVSCVIWTLTLQTTVKYVLITLRADNKGEGGILALFALLRKKQRKVYLIAMIGASALLADGIITPSITVLSAVEGLQWVSASIPPIPVALFILALLFTFQQFGTSLVGKSFGPVMLLWFSMLAVLGLAQIVHCPDILRAFNPIYGLRLLHEYPHGILILGAVFLCTTGAEALYSDLGHCGAGNIRMAWIFVKTSLILNYLGQGAWVITRMQPGVEVPNPFFAIMPSWFLIPGVVLSTIAAIVASQALISGSYTIISEALTLNFWPKVAVKYPARFKGQMYIPSVNWQLFVCCVFIVLFFQHSSNMEAAYGLSITLTMIMTTLLMFFYFKVRKVPVYIQVLFLVVYLFIEGTFLLANLHKFPYGGWVTILLAGAIFFIMFVWYMGRNIKKLYTQFLPIRDYAGVLSDLQQDTSVSKFATNLVYVTRAENPSQVEAKIIYSILNKQPKRADLYWLVCLNITDEPYTKSYKVHHSVPGTLYRVDFNLGFKVSTRINSYFQQVVSDMSASGEIDVLSRYTSLRRHKIMGDFRFIIIDRLATIDFHFSPFQRFIMNAYELVKKMSMSSVRAYGLDTSSVMIEQVPLGGIRYHNEGLIRMTEAPAETTTPNESGPMVMTP